MGRLRLVVRGRRLLHAGIGLGNMDERKFRGFSARWNRRRAARIGPAPGSRGACVDRHPGWVKSLTAHCGSRAEGESELTNAEPDRAGAGGRRPPAGQRVSPMLNYTAPAGLVSLGP